MIYADSAYYKTVFYGKQEITDADLLRASRHIDLLTFNRAAAFEKLSPAQQEVIKTVTCELAEFEVTNKELIDAGFSSYSLNGVSMSFDTAAIKNIDGVYIRRDTYEYLMMTGLCNRSLGVF